jgi:hypothetical protein
LKLLGFYRSSENAFENPDWFAEANGYISQRTIQNPITGGYTREQEDTAK